MFEELIDISKEITESYNIKNNTHFSNLLAYDLLKNHFYEKGIYIFKTKPSLATQYEVIIKNHFEEGFSNNTIDKFKDTYFEIFKDDSIYKKSNRSIFARAVDNNIILVDRGTYRYRKKEDYYLDKVLVDNIYKFIEKYQTVYISSVFENFKSDLKPFVSNRYELHSVLKEYFPLLYTNRDMISLYENPKISVIDILEKFSLENNGLINLKTIKKDLPQIKGVNLDLVLGDDTNDKFLGISTNKIINVDYLYYDDEEMIKIKKIIDYDLNRDILVRTNKVYDLMERYAPNTFYKNNIKGTNYAYNIFKYYYSNEYIYDFPFIRINKMEIGFKDIDYL